MKVTLAVTGTRSSGKITLINYLTQHLESLGATIVEGQDSITVVASPGFLLPALMETQKETAQLMAAPAPVNLLREASDIINGDREKTYGDAGKNLRNIAAYWSLKLNATYNKNICLTPADVSGMMILLKQARLDNNPNHRDSLLDIAGYAGLQDKVRQQEQDTQLAEKYPRSEGAMSSTK